MEIFMQENELKNIQIIADYHTHTQYSHGTGSVMDNAKYAKSIGIKEIAITDHGFNHISFGIKRKKLKELREDIEEAKIETGINILFGIEANIISSEGDLDLIPSDFEYIDFIVAGFHKSVWATSFKQWITFILANIIDDIFGRYSQKRVQKNTQAYIKMLDKYPVDVISHLNHNAKVDCFKVAKKCEETNTYIEINGKREHFNYEEMKQILSTNASLLANSDAHQPEKVGNIEIIKPQIKRYNIPLDRIINLKDTINIKNKR